MYRPHVMISIAMNCLLGGCGWTPAQTPLEDPGIDWRALETHTYILFDVSCAENSAEDLEREYRTSTYTAVVRSAPRCQRYLLRTDRASGHQDVYFAGANISQLLCFVDAFDFTKLYDPELEVRVHHKYLKFANVALDDLETLLNVEAGISVWGYSSGGGVACVAGTKLIHRGYDVHAITTLGQSAVTDARGADALRSVPLLRIVTGRDWAVLARNGYAHFGNEVVVLNESEFACLQMDDSAYELSTDPDAGPFDFFCHTNYLPYMQYMTEACSHVPYELPRTPLPMHGVFPCDFSRMRDRNLFQKAPGVVPSPLAMGE